MADGFTSEAQRTKWRQLLDEGKVTAEQFAARDAASAKTLPERAPVRPRTTGASRGFDRSQFGTGKGFDVDH